MGPITLPRGPFREPPPAPRADSRVFRELWGEPEHSQSYRLLHGILSALRWLLWVPSLVQNDLELRSKALVHFKSPPMGQVAY